MRKQIVKKVVVLGCLVGMMVNAMPAGAKATSGTIMKKYAEYVQNCDDTGYKYFALVDANKDGKPELLAVNKMKKGKIKEHVDVVSFYINSGEPVSAGGYGTDEYIYYNKKQKGLLISKDDYEYLDGVFKYRKGKVYSSNMKNIIKNKKGKGYTIEEGHISGEYGIKTKKISESQLKEYRKTWAFTKTSKDTCKVKFYKATKTNIAKLKKGKIVVQK